MSGVELKSCPFCGCAADIEHLEIGRYSVGCRDDDGECMGFQVFQTFPCKADAIAAWNKRATAPESPMAQLQRLGQETPDHERHPEVEVKDYYSDPAKAHLAIRDGLNRTIFNALREYSMGNMVDADDHWSPYPLVDLMSNPAPADITTGEMEMISLGDNVAEAVRAYLAAPQPDPRDALIEIQRKQLRGRDLALGVDADLHKAELAQRDALIGELRAALAWYANPSIYKPHPHGLGFDDRDLSYHAIAALAKIGGAL